MLSPKQMSSSWQAGWCGKDFSPKSSLPLFQPGWADKGQSSMHLASLWPTPQFTSCHLSDFNNCNQEEGNCRLHAAGQEEKRRSGVKNDPASRHTRMCGLVDLASSSSTASLVMYFPFTGGLICVESFLDCGHRVNCASRLSRNRNIPTPIFPPPPLPLHHPNSWSTHKTTLFLFFDY